VIERAAAAAEIGAVASAEKAGRAGHVGSWVFDVTKIGVNLASFLPLSER
jgi:hypothetical protein